MLGRAWARVRLAWGAAGLSSVMAGVGRGELVPLQQGGELGEERDVARRGPGFEPNASSRLVCSRARELVADVDEAAFEVDVSPDETEQFGEAQAGVERGGEERVVAGQRRVEQAADLYVVEHALLAAVDAGSFVLFQAAEGGVGDMAPAGGGLEDAPERDEGAVDRLRGQPLGAQAGD